jgi:hypothetical protein
MDTLKVITISFFLWLSKHKLNIIGIDSLSAHVNIFFVLEFIIIFLLLSGLIIVADNALNLG